MDGWTDGVRDRRKEGRMNVRTKGRKGIKGGRAPGTEIWGSGNVGFFVLDLLRGSWGVPGSNYGPIWPSKTL